jgi:hypothetical protein
LSEFLLAEFATTHATIEAAQTAARAGMLADDVLSPNPLAGIEEHLAPPSAKPPIGWVMFIAGALGAIAGYAMQWYSAVIDYPINSGGRGLNSWPAFLLVPYETAILAAAIVGILAWMWMCGLPKLFHPLFAAKAVEHAMQDRYLLLFKDRDELAAQIRRTLNPEAIHELRE